jgi:chemotaxis protein CheD
MATILVNMADLNVAASPDTLTTIGLGSCVGLVLYDALVKIGGMAHIMLPDSAINTDFKNKAKFADTAVETLIQLIASRGAHPGRLSAKLAGGANMFSTSSQNDIMKVGQRNVDACRRLLKNRNIPILSEDTGGNVGRTIEFYPDSCLLKVRTVWPKNEKMI